MASNNVQIEVNGIDSLVADFESATDIVGGDPKWVVGTHVEYAVHLEFGTSKMPPYPFLRPAVEYVMQNEADGIADSADSVDEVVGGIAMAIETHAKRFATTGVPPGPDVQTGNLRSSIRAEKVR